MFTRKFEFSSYCFIFSTHYVTVLRVGSFKWSKFSWHIQNSIPLELHFCFEFANIWNEIKFKNFLNLIILKTSQVCWWLSNFFFANFIPVLSFFIKVKFHICYSIFRILRFLLLLLLLLLLLFLLLLLILLSFYLTPLTILLIILFLFTFFSFIEAKLIFWIILGFRIRNNFWFHYSITKMSSFLKLMWKRY